MKDTNPTATYQNVQDTWRDLMQSFETLNRIYSEDEKDENVDVIKCMNEITGKYDAFLQATDSYLKANPIAPESQYSFIRFLQALKDFVRSLITMFQIDYSEIRKNVTEVTNNRASFEKGYLRLLETSRKLEDDIARQVIDESKETYESEQEARKQEARKAEVVTILDDLKGMLEDLQELSNPSLEHDKLRESTNSPTSVTTPVITETTKPTMEPSTVDQKARSKEPTKSKVVYPIISTADFEHLERIKKSRGSKVSSHFSSQTNQLRDKNRTYFQVAGKTGENDIIYSMTNAEYNRYMTSASSNTEKFDQSIRRKTEKAIGPSRLKETGVPSSSKTDGLVVGEGPEAVATDLITEMVEEHAKAEVVYPIISTEDFKQLERIKKSGGSKVKEHFSSQTNQLRDKNRTYFQVAGKTGEKDIIYSMTKKEFDNFMTSAPSTVRGFKN